MDQTMPGSLDERTGEPSATGKAADPAPAESHAAAGSDPSDTGSVLGAGFSVPISIELESTTLPLAQLQALRTGSVIPVDTVDGAIGVRILASGKPFARGTLVSVGDAYGVLVEED